MDIGLIMNIQSLPIQDKIISTAYFYSNIHKIETSAKITISMKAIKLLK